VSTIPLLEEPIEGPILKPDIADATRDALVEDLVRAEQQLARVRDARQRATQTIADTDKTLEHAKRAVDQARAAFETYITARVEAPL